MCNLTKKQVKKLFVSDSGFCMKKDAKEELYYRLGVLIEEMGTACINRIKRKVSDRERKHNKKSVTIEDIMDIFDLKIVEVKQ